MLEILEDRGLSFIFPLMRVQSELGRQISAEPTAGAIFKWIKERVDPQLFTNPKFVNILVTRWVPALFFFFPAKYTVSHNSVRILTESVGLPTISRCLTLA